MKYLLLTLFCLPLLSAAQDGIKPIFDVHLHGYTERSYRPVPGAPESYEGFKAGVQDYIEKYNIVAAVKSGGTYGDELEEMMLSGYESNNYPKFDTVEFKQMIAEGKIQVWGEFMPMFNGMTIGDPGFAPYLAICEREGIPIALHTGSGPPGLSYRYTKSRLTLGDPLHMEDVLIKYPRLKIYLMHSGGVFYEHALALMDIYPQLYGDLGALLWVDQGLTSTLARKILISVKEAGHIDRIMFGSDGMYWPQKIEESIQRLDGFEFLTEEDKRKIFYENAVKFFGLDLED